MAGNGPAWHPRLIFDKTGGLAATKRHDHLPFGEEIGGAQVALIGGRTTGQGYTSDSTRQHFTGYELDAETGLNFAQARYQSSVQGRFTSVDPLGASASVGDPQSFNRYSYVKNNSTNLTDPSGLAPYGADRAWSDVSDGFWGRSVDLNRSHFGGAAIVYAAGLLQGIAVEGGIQERSHASRNSGSYKPNWLARGINAAIDRRTGFSFAGGGGGDVAVSGQVTGIEPGQDSEFPCWSIDKILADDGIQNVFSQTHADAKVGTDDSHEEGGLIFEDQQSGGLVSFRAPAGSAHSMPDFQKWYAQVKKGLPSTRSLRLLMWFHAHTANSTPSYDDRMVSAWPNLQVPGAIIEPNGKGIVVFDQKGVIPANSEKRKICY